MIDMAIRRGRLVVVHPFLTRDPCHMQGKIGIVKKVVGDTLYVKFEGKRKLCAYQSDAVHTRRRKSKK